MFQNLSEEFSEHVGMPWGDRIPHLSSPLPDQGKFWEDLAEKRRQLYNSKLEQVRQTAESILGPGAC